MLHDKLVHMANQIAKFCASNPDGARHTADVADHINKFWDPRMREKLVAKAKAGATQDMHPLVIDAIAHVRVPTTAAGQAEATPLAQER